MKIAALESSTPVGGVALVEDGEVAAESICLMRRSHSRLLVADLVELLGRLGWRVGDVDLWSTSSGPGSFTGLRIGMATVKGLAYSTGRPMACSSSLACLARQALPFEGWILPMLDARKKEVYTALFRASGFDLEMAGRQEVADPISAASGASATTMAGPVLLVGDGALLYREQLDGLLAGAIFAGQDLSFPRPSTTALEAARRHLDGERWPLEAAEPVYIRPSDAEIGRRRARPHP